ncbi:hypothetical protein NBE98_17270 [Clostridium swellfunianum]|uniref:hypothetical protein n=1 Tax=Clostridium swellfunianum TaxID=1367462 RepID=UPI002030CC95|nr:hypothetical protein [Clostridium swellfunianum]MCM0650121.1 hypothetical protein [Clostridium swellfunianum]
MKYLCVDDDIRDKQLYCETYNLEPERVLYADTLNKALDIIDNNFGEFDAAILDINIAIENDDYLDKLKGIVTQERLKNGSSTDGGFYIYLKLLDKGFPNNRIAFLSAYINEDDIKGYAERINELLKLMASSGMLKETGAAQSFAEIEQQVYLSLAYLRTVNALKYPINNVIKQLKAGLYKDAFEGLQSINNSSSNSLEEISAAAEATKEQNNIEKSFKAFHEAGINIPSERKFSKSANKYYATSDKTEAKGLVKWLKNLDKNSYYALRSGIIEGCIEYLSYLNKAKAMLKQKQEDFNAQLVEEYKPYRNSYSYGKSKLRGLIFNYENDINNTMEGILPFYKIVDGKHNTKLRKRYSVEAYNYIEEEIFSNEKKEIYDIEYFEDMLYWLKEALPLREPEENGRKQLYRQIIKQLSHPYEAAFVSQPKINRYDRKKLLQCSIAAVLKCVRNWTAHSRISEFDEKDMAFLFVLFMRSYFGKNLDAVSAWEKSLVKISAAEDKSLAELEAAISKTKPEGIDELITKSLNNIIKENRKKLSSLNMYEVLTDIGKKNNCFSDYLYKMFWHTMYFPYYDMDNIIPVVGYNHEENTMLDSAGKQDILTLLYIASFKKAFN